MHCALPSCPGNARTYNAPMLDIKLIRERPDFVRQRLATRGAGDEARIDEVLSCDAQRRKLLGEVEAMKAQRKRVSKDIGSLMGQKKLAEAEAKKKEMGDLGDRIAELDKQAAEAEAARNQLMLRLPNLPRAAAVLPRRSCLLGSPLGCTTTSGLRKTWHAGASKAGHLR